MKKFKKLKMAALAFVSTVSLFTFQPPTETEAASFTHTVRSGDTLWKISNHYGVGLTTLRAANNQTSNMIYVGQKLVIPQSTISAADKDLMARLVSAEAKGEPYAGKVAVATVILNRLDHPEFPNTVKEVIYQIDHGYYAFTPVQNGTINQPADVESKRAVSEALAYRGQGNGSLYFYNPNTASSSWIYSRPVTVTIGNHRFAK
ncbi:cell wall hydrolase [Niallia endozanthoxylica]|uniref:LysM peptidoglycan-binding domain-containing protein n=1 Tax=Niallia endozanthoxylica TaxID=2036016 RepID=A0A5J5HTG3_9BACI|nr:cell wall hydrolase [Niallia endozanthoxylica]KAA9023626.1 LysM peptidoglycan-binding domain-containing protein [Niallia endozanthoxylica]